MPSRSLRTQYANDNAKSPSQSHGGTSVAVRPSYPSPAPTTSSGVHPADDEEGEVEIEDRGEDEEDEEEMENEEEGEKEEGEESEFESDEESFDEVLFITMNRSLLRYRRIMMGAQSLFDKDSEEGIKRKLSVSWQRRRLIKVALSNKVTSTKELDIINRTRHMPGGEEMLELWLNLGRDGVPNKIRCKREDGCECFLVGLAQLTFL